MLTPCSSPFNAVSQVSEHQQEAIFARAEPNPRQASVRTFNTQEAAVDRRSKAALTHLPCNPLELRMLHISGSKKQSEAALFDVRWM